MAVTLACGLLCVVPGIAATFNVVDGDVAGLIAAIQTSNTNGEANTINLATKGTYLLTAIAESGSSEYGCCGTIGLPYIRTQLTIHGNGATIRRSDVAGTPLFGILAVAGAGDLTLDEVTLTGGRGDPSAPSNPVGVLGLASGRAYIRDVTITRNSAENPYWNGGGILNFCDNLTVVNSTISYNNSSSGYGGGGILQFSFNCSPKTYISFSTVFENRNYNGRGDSISNAFGAPDSVAIRNSILANPTDAPGSTTCYGTLPVSYGHNIAGDSSCAFAAPDDLNSADPMLGATADNGGNTATDLQAAGSPAVDAIPPGSCTDLSGNPVTTDQRGVARPQGSACDIGSVEVARASYGVCLLYDPARAVPSGATDPIKLQLCDAAGNNLSSSGTVLHATGVTQVSTAITGPVASPGNANPDSDFRYDPTLGGAGGYIFNLSTRGLTIGTYTLNFTAGSDSFIHSAPFQVK